MSRSTLLIVFGLLGHTTLAAGAERGSGLDGCLYWLDGTCAKWSEAEWRDEVRAMGRAGFRHVIVHGVAEAVSAPSDAAGAAASSGTAAAAHSGAAGAATQPGSAGSVTQAASGGTGIQPAEVGTATQAVSAGAAARAGAGGAAAQPGSAEAATLTACERLMRAGDEAGLRVYLSLLASPEWYTRWKLSEEIEANRRLVPRLLERFGGHRCFAGWYIPHEIYVMWDGPGRYMRDLYRELARLCKEATSDKKVLLSPFFILDREGWLGSFRYATPSEYEAFWAEVLAQTRIDVVAVQDSGEHLACYSMDQRRPFLAAMQRACRRAGKEFWVNIETGELDVAGFEDYARRFGRGTPVNDAKTAGAWRSVPPARLREKLRLAHEFTDTTITWGYREHWDPRRGDAAKAVYDSYLREAASTATRPASAPAW